MFMVGPDNVLRTEARALQEDKSAYLNLLRANGVKPGLINRIDFTDTAAGQMPIDSQSVAQALAGQTGTGEEKKLPQPNRLYRLCAD